MPALVTAARSNDRRRLYVALRNDLAKKLEVTESGRDYAALSKSLITVTEKLDEIDKQSAKDNTQKAKVSKLAAARDKRMKLVSNG